MQSFYFSSAFEQLYLMQEIQNTHPFDPQIISGLEKWILMKCSQIFENYKDDIDSLSQHDTSNFKPLGKRKILF